MTAPVGCVFFGLRFAALCQLGILMYVSLLAVEVDSSASRLVASGFLASTVLLMFVSFDKTTKLKCAVISSSAQSGISREA